jgi:hypothetical protein
MNETKRKETDLLSILVSWSYIMRKETDLLNKDECRHVNDGLI